MAAGRLSVAFVLLLMAGAATPIAQQPPPPADLPAKYRGGDIDRALKAQDWPRAETLLVRAIERRPQERELLEVLGSLFLVQRKPLNAAIAFKKAEALGPLDDRARFALALAYISMSRGEWARPELETLVASDTSNPAYEYWLGRLDYDAGRYAAAAARFEAVIARDASFVRAYDNLGLAYDALNEPGRALDAHRKAVTLNRAAAVSSPWPPLNLGILLRERGDLAEAEAAVREALSYDDGLAQAHYQLGMLLEQAGKDEDAAAALQRAAQCDPQYAAPHYALARIYRRLARPAEAAEALTAFERLRQRERESSRP